MGRLRGMSHLRFVGVCGGGGGVGGGGFGGGVAGGGVGVGGGGGGVGGGGIISRSVSHIISLFSLFPFPIFFLSPPGWIWNGKP